MNQIFPPLKLSLELVSIGESARLAPSSSFHVVSSVTLGCKSFEIGDDFKSKDLTSFLD